MTVPRPGSADRARVPVLLAQDGDVVLGPLRIGHAGALLLALPRRRAPEPDLLEVLRAVGDAAGIRQKRIALAGRRYRRDRSEPRGHIALHLRVQRVLQ